MKRPEYGAAQGATVHFASALCRLCGETPPFPYLNKRSTKTACWIQSSVLSKCWRIRPWQQKDWEVLDFLRRREDCLIKEAKLQRRGSNERTCRAAVEGKLSCGSVSPDLRRWTIHPVMLWLTRRDHVHCCHVKSTGVKLNSPTLSQLRVFFNHKCKKCVLFCLVILLWEEGFN